MKAKSESNPLDREPEPHMKKTMASFDFELNWYDLETRSRKLVFELMQPSVVRSAEDREMLYV
jgi:hypothetical protein